ncbi:hypothetical protein OPV22_031585 [Ensete ventricosum]|uniref:Sugar phosphate transporter domain-containing protein n=1 Tax=Ensete ventricosum TaxID=4639 RepID=A0AAV8PPD0_ENSVE|nr:hypothetical protein OPV22_031585 [Ensete ventricosum]
MARVRSLSLRALVPLLDLLHSQSNASVLVARIYDLPELGFHLSWPDPCKLKAALDVAAWMFNIVTSVGIIMINKALMATHHFTFATTLTGLHFATTTLLTIIFRWLGYIQPSHLPLSNLIKFVLFANLSIVGMNISLMWNSVGFYQIAKLSMIPVSCLLEVVFDKIHYSRATKLSIVVVLVGVAICTVTDVSVNARGLIAATIAVWSTALQQYYVHFLQKKYSLGSFNLLGHTAPVQAASLLILGPFVDYWLTSKRVDKFDYSVTAVFFIVLSCTIAVGTNLSQFICIGRFTAVSFQVLGHMKTVLVLTLGFFLFGREGLNLHVEKSDGLIRYPSTNLRSMGSSQKQETMTTKSKLPPFTCLHLSSFPTGIPLRLNRAGGCSIGGPPCETSSTSLKDLSEFMAGQLKEVMLCALRVRVPNVVDRYAMAFLFILPLVPVDSSLRPPPPQIGRVI